MLEIGIGRTTGVIGGIVTEAVAAAITKSSTQPVPSTDNS